VFIQIGKKFDVLGMWLAKTDNAEVTGNGIFDP
jgi:hypothetical protein